MPAGSYRTPRGIPQVKSKPATRFDVMQHLSTSTHAPRVGSDQVRVRGRWLVRVSIHAPPCGERLGGMREECEAQGFNPRPPMWGTTGTAFQLLTHDAVSTHASHVGSDKRIKWGGWDQNRFQPTLPVWGATGRSWTGKPVEVVSTHAPRVGSDDSRRVHQRCRECFNPRSPCGERRRPWTSPASPTGFNPRPPV